MIKKINNPFILYEGKKHIKELRKTTRELKNAWKEFGSKIRQIQFDHSKVGALDTVSREEFSDYVTDRTEKGDLM